MGNPSRSSSVQFFYECNPAFFLGHKSGLFSGSGHQIATVNWVRPLVIKSCTYLSPSMSKFSKIPQERGRAYFMVSNWGIKTSVIIHLLTLIIKWGRFPGAAMRPTRSLAQRFMCQAQWILPDLHSRLLACAWQWCLPGNL